MLLLACLLASTPYAPGIVFVPTADIGLYRLANLLLERSSEVSAAKREVELSLAQVAQSELYKNPELRLGVGNIAVPPTNPPGLNLLTQSMYYQVGLAYTLELDKRGRRQARDRHLSAAAKAGLAATLREQSLSLARSLGAAAAAELRIHTLAAPTKDAKPDNPRLELEQIRLGEARLAAEGERASALGECSRLVGLRCGAFTSPEQARSFLQGWIDGKVDGTQVARQDVESRWEVRGLDAEIAAQKEATGLAQAQLWPDLTLSVGYMHDRFTSAGHNMNAFNVGVSLPLPVFDRGQAAAQGARAAAHRLQEERERAIAGAHERIALLREALATQAKRRALITNELLPRALGVAAELEKTVSPASVGDVIVARRTLIELTLAETDSQHAAFAATLDLLSELGEPAQKTAP